VIAFHSNVRRFPTGVFDNLKASQNRFFRFNVDSRHTKRFPTYIQGRSRSPKFCLQKCLLKAPCVFVFM